MILKTIDIMKKLIFLLLLALPFFGFSQAAYLMEFTNPNGSKVVFNLNDVRSCVAEGTGSYLFTRTGSGKTQVQESPATIALNSCGNIVLFTVYLPANQFNNTKQMGVNPNYVVGVVSNTSGNGVLKMVTPTENFTTTGDYDAAVSALSNCVSGGGGGGSLTNTYVGFGDGLNQLDGEAGFTYDAESNRLAVDTLKTKRISSKSGALEIFNDTKFNAYPNTRNDAGVPVNVLTTSATGGVESHPVLELRDSLLKATNGTSYNSISKSIELGNAVGGTSAQLTSAREIPLNDKTIKFSGGSANGGLLLDGASVGYTNASGFLVVTPSAAKPGIFIGTGGAGTSSAAYIRQTTGGVGLYFEKHAASTTDGIFLEQNSASGAGMLCQLNAANATGIQVSATAPGSNAIGVLSSVSAGTGSVPFRGIAGTGSAFQFWKFGGTDGGSALFGEFRFGPNGFNVPSSNGTAFRQSMSIESSSGVVEAAAFGGRLDDNGTLTSKGSALIYSAINNSGAASLHAEFIGHSLLPASFGQRLTLLQGNLQATGKIIDSAGSAGTSAQVLTSTGTGTAYSSNPFSALTVITAATSDLANTAFGGAVGTLFWWKPTGSSGKILMEKE